MSKHYDPDEFAVSTWLYMTSSLDVALQNIAGAGFKQVELWGDQAHVDPRLKPDVGAIRSQLRELGLQASSLHCPFGQLDIGYPDDTLMPRWLEIVGDSLQIAADLGAAVAVVHIRSFREPLASADMERKSQDLTLQLVHTLQNQARRLGVQLALENRGSSALAGFGASLQALTRMFPDPDIGLCLDIGHAVIQSLDFRSEIRAAGRRLLTLHVHSNDGARDLHWLPGRGVPDWDMIAAELNTFGYRGVNTLEINGAVEPDALLAACAQFVAAEKLRASRSSVAGK